MIDLQRLLYPVVGSDQRSALRATNDRKRRTGWFICVLTMAALALVAVTVG